MEVKIRIDGVLIDGVTPGSVKLNINNPDPLKFTDPTVSYTASISLPRTETNDRVFKSERFPNLYTRTTPYVAQLDFDGLAAPLGGNSYRARVSASPDGYTVELIESISKLSTALGPVAVRPSITSAAYWAAKYDDAITEAYPGKFSRPPLFTQDDSILIYPAYFADTKTVTAADYVDSSTALAYKGGHDGNLGATYPSGIMLPTDNGVSAALERLTGTNFVLRVGKESYFILPPSTPATIYLFSNCSGPQTIPFVRGTLRGDGNYEYKCPTAAIASLTVTPSDGQLMQFGLSPSKSLLAYLLIPVSTVPTSEGYLISLTIVSVGTPTYSRTLMDNMGLSTPFEIVQAYCKAFCWTYSFTSSPFTLTLKPFISPLTTAEYRQDWTGRIDTTTINISEPDGAARTYKAQVGDLNVSVGGANRAIAIDSTVGESALPVMPGSLGERPYATMIRKYSTGNWYPDNYFNRTSGYRATVAGHYARFSKGWQAKATMNLSYFDIKNMRPDALYYVDELGSWFYLRSIQNWNASTCKANVTLIAVNN